MSEPQWDVKTCCVRKAQGHPHGTVPRLEACVSTEFTLHPTTSTIEMTYQSSLSSSASSPVGEKSVSSRSRTRFQFVSFVPQCWWSFFSVYRCLNILVLTANASSIIVLASQGKLCCMLPGAVATAISINLAVAVLIRQELVINALFWSAGRCPRSWPLCVRRTIAKIYHLGGIHSGAGMSALLWLAEFHVSLVYAFRQGTLRSRRMVITAISATLDVLLISIVLMAHPYIRMRMHNAFELVHRLAGWTSLILFWALFGILTKVSVEDSPGGSSFRSVVVVSPVFWTLVVITLSVALPWFSLRRVAVRAVPLSGHAIRLYFNYTNLPLCAAIRVSDRPLLEWHAFAAIPQENGGDFSVLVSRAGDWTSRLIQRPPTKLWVRGTPAIGLLHLARIFSKVVLVATGSGIGPILSLLGEKDLAYRILWSTRDPESTYSTAVMDEVRRADPAAAIINTTHVGRPNLIQHVYELYVTSGAEAVFVISNPVVTKRTVHSLESRGVPVFAPIFDS